MHREFDSRENPFQPRSNSGLYLLTALVVGLLLADLLPLLVQATKGWNLPLPTWTTRELYGFRFALLAAILGGAKSLYQSLERLTEGHIGADLAVAIACIAAIFLGEPLIAAEVVVIGLVGECLEAYTFDRTQRAVRGLAELFPLRCWVLRDGQEVRVFTSQLQGGDTVVVKPGGKIPVDGVVLAGTSDVDTASLTGESVPVLKRPGDTVLAGSVVQLGSLTILAQKLAKSTVAGQVIEQTAQALRQKSEGERLADRLARYFLPVVLVLALVTFLFNVWWQSSGGKLPFNLAARLAAYPTLAVLVVACPCPLILATPTALIAALGRLAGTGILLKSGAALERLASIQQFALDKTGTLTEGQPDVVQLFPVQPDAELDLLKWAASLEQSSEHPVARAILRQATDKAVSLETIRDFQAVPGSGVQGRNDSGQQLLVGTARWLLEQGVPIPQELQVRVEPAEATGQTVVFVARDHECLGAITLADRLRPSAIGALDDLRQSGVTGITLLTGDRAAPARAIAAQLPRVIVYSELLPADKAERVEQLNPVAFVGDGINDAPALARAAVGLAVGKGTDLAAQSSDIILMGDPLRPLGLLLRLSREFVRVVRQNIIWFGFGVNLVGVIIAGFFWPLFATSPAWFENAPLFGVIYHQLGSLAVLFNAMRLLRFEKPQLGRVESTLRLWSEQIEGLLSRLDLDEMLHELGHRWRAVLGAVAVLAFLGWLVSGITIINAEEVGVVQRFGAVQPDLQPGFHFRWPTPIESVIRVKPSQPRTVEVGFRLLSDEALDLLQKGRLEQDKLRRANVGTSPMGRDSSLTWGAAHAEGLQRLTDESLLITGDGNLVEVLATITYRITEPRKFALEVNNVDGIIRSAAESLFREQAAGEPFLELLTIRRTPFQERLNRLLAERLKQVSPNGLGIELDAVTLHDLHPPQEVVSAYHAVAEAIQRRDRTINEALAESLRQRRRAEEDSLRIVRQAEVERLRKLAEAAASRDAFLAWVQQRNQVSTEEQKQLEALRAQLLQSGKSPPEADDIVAARRQELLRPRKQLSEFRLTLDAVTQVLKSRDKIIIDANHLPGKRHLLLMDPDAAPKLPPLAFPRGDQ